MLLVRIQLLQPGHHVRPKHIRIGVDEEVPFVSWSGGVGLLGHVDILVLVECPALSRRVLAFVAGFLIDGTIPLAPIEIEIAVSILRLGKNSIQAVLDVLSRDGLLHVAEDEVVRETT
jgi:hypothetical protein